MASPDTEEMTLTPPSRRHAVWLLTLPMGASDGSEQQVQALFAPQYQLARRGVSFVASPRHADIVLVTGALTHRMLDAVRRVLGQVPDPHAIIAVGDAALNGGVYADSTEIVPNAGDVLGVNVEIAGSPPTPTQILHAIEEAAQLLDQADTSEDAADDDAADAEDDAADAEVAEVEEEDSHE